MLKNTGLKTLVLMFLLVTPIFAVSAPPPTSVITKNGSTGGGGSGLPADPAACGANLFATDQDINGVLTCTQPSASNLSNGVSGTGAVVLATGNAATATALAANPADCAANQFATTIAASGALTCATITAASANFANQGTTTTLLHGNAAGNPSWGAVNLGTAEVTGTNPVANGGTGIATTTAYSPVFSGTTATGAWSASIGPGTATQVLTSNGAGVLPSWQAAGGGGAPTTATYITISTDGTLTNERTLAVNPTLSLTDAGAGSTVTLANLEPDRVATCTEEFMSYLATWDCGFTSASGTGAAVANDSPASSDALHPGVAKLSTGTTATGLARRLFSNSNLVYVGSATIRFDSIIKIPTVSDGTDTFTVTAGIWGFNTTDGCYVQYSHGLNTGKFLYISEAGAAQSTADSGLTVAAATWYHIVVEIAADRSACTFSINGANTGTISTNIVLATTALLPDTQIEKSAGTTSRDLLLDFQRIRYIFSSAR